MKSVFRFLLAFTLALFFGSVLVNEGIDKAVAIGVVAVSLFASAPKGVLLVGINATQVKEELGAYLRTNNKELRPMIYNGAQASNYMKKLVKVQGRYPAGHTVTSNVVQGFKAVWNEMGETKFVANDLIDYHQKVNYPIIPAEILGSWYAEMYDEKKTPAEKPISQYIIEKELKPKVISNVDYLIGNGVYDANDLETFGKSMNGLKKILADGVASSTKPMFKIPLAPLTDNNIVDQVEKFEREIPDKIDASITKIYMSSKNKKRYMQDYRNLYGANNDFSKGQTLVTYTGEREIVGLRCLNGSDVIFATPDENFLQLNNDITTPIITDVQVQDYKVKVFMEWWMGVAFWINQMVLVSVSTGSGSGLTTDNELYYGG